MRAILTYHSIDASGSPISIDAVSFARHVDFLASGKVRVVPLAEIEAARDADDVVAITFDDGLVNFENEAWPLLAERGLPATLFVVTGRVGKDNAWQGERDPRVPHVELLGWDALGKLAAQGLELGAHSRTHPHLEHISDARQVDEIEGAADDLLRYAGKRPHSFCYPYGTLDERAVARTARTYRRACTTELAVLDGRESAHRLPRLDAFYLRGAGRLESFGELAFRVRIQVLRAARNLRARLRK
ncbi:MAG TPA: polysaccharide deacetylase family protein [Planctomycetota bacterium]|nr:polysaccharide deacetylase family protein [Planctomycetota bacterium]